MADEDDDALAILKSNNSSSVTLKPEVIEDIENKSISAASFHIADNTFTTTPANKLKQFVYPVEPLCLDQMEISSDKTTPYPQVYECRILSVHNMNTEATTTNNTTEVNSNQPTITERNSAETSHQRNTEVPVHTSHVEETINNVVVTGPVQEPVLMPQMPGGPNTAGRIKRRPNKHSLGTGRCGAVEAWVLLDSEGNTQEVSERDVNILLGERSVDSVLSLSPEHQMPPSVIDRNSQSETGTARLEPIIQESLLLLRRDNSIGEHALSRRLNLERKTDNMLMHITQPNVAETDEMQPATSVHFVNIETDRLIQWRHSQEFNGASGHKFESFMNGGIFQASKPRQPLAHDTVLQEISEVDISVQDKTESLKTTPTMKKKSFNILRKFLANNNNNNRPKSKSIDDDVTSPKTSLDHILSDIRETTHLARIKLEEDAIKYQKIAERKSRLLQEEKFKTSTLQSELKKAREKERQANIENEETFLANYALSTSDNDAIYDTAIENCQSIQVQETALETIKREVEELKFIMLESENTIKKSIAKYVADKQLEKQLLAAVESYSHTKVEGEHRVNALTQDLIEEQVGLLKTHKQNTEANINDLKKRNETLEDENIVLLKKIEKLQSKTLKRSSEFNVNDLIYIDKDESNYMLKNNELLRNKLSYNRSRIQIMESQLQEANNKVEYLDSQVRNLKIEAENQKLVKSRMEADFEIKHTVLNLELQVKSQILQQSIQAADVLVDDMESLSKLLKDTGSKVQIKWSKLQGGDNSLMNLLHIGRSCINELGRELINTQNQLSATNQEIVRQEHSKKQLEQSLAKTTNKTSLLKVKLEEVINQKKKSEELLEHITQENARLHDHLGIAVESQIALEKEINKIEKINGMQSRQEVIGDKVGKAIQEVFANNVKKELDTQVKNLMEENKIMLENVKAAELNNKLLQNKILSEAEEKKNQNHDGIMKELRKTNTALNKEIEILRRSTLCSSSDVNKASKLVNVEKELNDLMQEKVRLSKELQSYKTEREALLESQNSCLAHNKIIQDDIEILIQENTMLKTQHEHDQTMLLCLGYDPNGMAGMASVNSVENAIRNMQAELVGKRDKRKNLEYVVSENNKKIEQLEKSSSEKDLLIRTLDHQVAQMSNISRLEIVSIQHKNDQLEANLKTLSQENEEKRTKLVAAQGEIQLLLKMVKEKNVQLDRYKEMEKELECHYAVDKERIEETAMLKGRLKDFNNIINQRDKLIESQKEFLSEIENLHDNLKKREKKIDSLTKDCTMQAVKIAEFEEKLKYTRSILNQTSGSAETNLRGVQGLQLELKDATTKLSEYEKHITEMDRGIEKHVIKMEQDRENVQKEKIKLEEQVNHLKNLITGQQTSLDEALKQIRLMRKVEKELRNMVDDEKKQRLLLENIINKQEKALAETDNLKESLDEKNMECFQQDLEYRHYQEKVAKGNEMMKDACEKQVQIVNDLKQELESINKTKTKLEMELDLLQKKMATVEDRNMLLEKNVGAHGKTLHDLILEKRNSTEQAHRIEILETEKSKLEEIYQLEQAARSDVELALLTAKKQLSKMEKELDNSYASLHHEQSEKQLAIVSVKSLHSDQMKRLLKEIKELGLSKQQVEQSVLEEKQANQLLAREHEELSDKLLRAVRLAIEEKMSRQNVEIQVQQLGSIKLQLESEKDSNATTMLELTENVKMLNQRIEDLTCEKQELVKTIADLEKQSEERLEVKKKEVQDLQNKFRDTCNHTENEKEILKEHLDFKDEILQVKEKQIQSTEERVNRVTSELTEARDCLLKQRQIEGNLQREILNMQAEKRELSSQLHTLNGHKQEETQLRLELQKTCQGLLDQMAKKSVTPRSVSRVRKLIATTLPIN